jgi:hypothetical protein
MRGLCFSIFVLFILGCSAETNSRKSGSSTSGERDASAEEIGGSRDADSDQSDWQDGLLHVDLSVAVDGGGDLDAKPDRDVRRPPFLLPTCSSPVVDNLTTDGAPARNSSEYDVPSEVLLENIQDSITHALDGDLESSESFAQLAAYSLCRGAGDESNLLLWMPLEPGTGQAQLVIRLGDAAALVLGVPHPHFEAEVLAEGIEIFTAARARALVVSGTHRCANLGASTCDGTTGVCSDSSAAYRESDQAHVVGSTFQRAHEVVFDRSPDSIVVSLHGMRRDGISLSNGTTQAVDPSSPVATLAASLLAVFPDQTITTCNGYEGANRETHLCGTTNTQGRYVNGSPDACEDAAGQATGRFVHMEQSRSVRGERVKVAAAFAAWLAR